MIDSLFSFLVAMAKIINLSFSQVLQYALYPLAFLHLHYS